MGGPSKIAVIDGKNGLTGHLRQTPSGLGNVLISPTITTQEKPIVLQLKRETLSVCKVGGLSGQFSHDGDITGMWAVIWCTGSGKGFQKAFYGTIERVSSHGKCQFVLRATRRASPGECYNVN